MSVRCLLKDTYFHNFRYSQILFNRPIKTEAVYRKGKINVVKRKFVNDMDKSYEILEIKESASALKQLNWENKHLFGDIISTVKKTYSLITKKKSLKKEHRNDRKVAEILNSEQIIPIKNEKPSIATGSIASNNVIPCEPAGNKLLASSNTVCHNVISNILNFPLTNKTNSSHSQENTDLVENLNDLRQYILSLCGSNSFPSITSILDKTMPPERAAGLQRWKSDMIKNMGPEGFKQYQEDLLNNGSTLHNSINMYLSGVPELEMVIEPGNTGHWKSLKKFLPFLNDVKLLEEHVSHPFLCYRGVIDCFAKYKNNFVVVDWKTSKKFKPSLSSTFDNPLQIAAYAGAMNFDEKLNYKANRGLIVVAYEKGSPASAHYMDPETLQNYWNEWLKRLMQYWQNIENSNKSVV